MNKIFTVLLVLIAVPLLITSCKDDDDAQPADQLVGSWLEVSFVSSGCTNPDDNETNTCTTCETLVVTSSTLKFGAETPFPYTADGNTLSVTVGSDIVTVVFEITGDTLILTIQDSADDGNCTKVTTYNRN